MVGKYGYSMRPFSLAKQSNYVQRIYKYEQIFM